MMHLGPQNTPRSRWIRALLVLKGISGAEIAREVGVHRSTIFKVIDGVTKSVRLRKAIAEALECHLMKSGVKKIRSYRK